jgi:hypothetical protein
MYWGFIFQQEHTNMAERVNSAGKCGTSTHTKAGVIGLTMFGWITSESKIQGVKCIIPPFFTCFPPHLVVRWERFKKPYGWTSQKLSPLCQEPTEGIGLTSEPVGITRLKAGEDVKH